MVKTYRKLNEEDIKSHQSIQLLLQAFDMFVAYVKFQTKVESYYSLEKITGISKLALATLSSKTTPRPSWNTFKKAIIYVAEADEHFAKVKMYVEQIEQIIPKLFELQLSQDQITTYAKELRTILDVNWVVTYEALNRKYQTAVTPGHIFDRLDANKPLALFMYITDHELLDAIPDKTESQKSPNKERSLLMMANYFLEFYPKDHTIDQSLFKQLSAIKMLNMPITKKELGLKNTQLVTNFYNSQIE